MPIDKICPFRYISAYSQKKECLKSECELWSTEMSMCSIFMGMNAVLSVADAIRGLSENIKTHFPE